VATRRAYEHLGIPFVERAPDEQSRLW
jgi:hypothetical protein